MLRRASTYEALVAGFDWKLPAQLNMAAQVCDDWAATEPERLAILDLSEAFSGEAPTGEAVQGGADTLIDAGRGEPVGGQAGERAEGAENAGRHSGGAQHGAGDAAGQETGQARGHTTGQAMGRAVRISYGQLYELSRRVEAALYQRGVQPGDRIGVLLSQSALCAAAHIAAWRMGAISVPLFKLFRQEALASRIGDAGLRVVVTDPEGAGMLAPFDVEAVLRADLPEVGHEGPSAPTGPDTPAVLIYTSGTTGKPKGALHGHRVLTGHLPGVELSHDFLGQPGAGAEDMLWTPADWAWIGGLFDVLMPGLALGVPVVAARADKFSLKIFDALVAQGVRNVFLPPTVLRMLKAEGGSLSGLRTVASGGEPLGAEMLAWGRAALGVTINEFYGQTECNMVASSCGALFDARPGCMGRAVPGFEVAVIDAAGQLTTTEEGDIAVRRGAGSMMLGYWNAPEATAQKFRGDWMLTGDRGVMERGFIRFVGREDDVITSAGYRIGPAEIEDCLLTHPAVVTVGVVGKPDPLRTEIVKAYVVTREGVAVTGGELQDWVKARSAAHSYPREVAFVTALPMTVTGKVIRKELKRMAAAEQAAEQGADG